MMFVCNVCRYIVYFLCAFRIARACLRSLPPPLCFDFPLLLCYSVGSQGRSGRMLRGGVKIVFSLSLVGWLDARIVLEIL